MLSSASVAYSAIHDCANIIQQAFANYAHTHTHTHKHTHTYTNTHTNVCYCICMPQHMHTPLPYVHTTYYICFQSKLFFKTSSTVTGSFISAGTQRHPRYRESGTSCGRAPVEGFQAVAPVRPNYLITCVCIPT